jgi:hypothetical protein
MKNLTALSNAKQLSKNEQQKVKGGMYNSCIGRCLPEYYCDEQWNKCIKIKIEIPQP